MPATVNGDGRRPETPPTRTASSLERPLPSSPSSAAAVGLSSYTDGVESSDRLRTPIGRPTGNLIRTVSTQSIHEPEKRIYLELADGVVYEGYSFGAEKSVSGELVFQTGMVGYPESVTDPSYRGQILVITFPLIGNYGVPSRKVMDELLVDLPKYFEASEIHVAGLVVASYVGEDFSHFLAESSLGTWLKEQGVPAMHGVDTRALTSRIREEGSMLGRMLHQKAAGSLTNGNHQANGRDSSNPSKWRDDVEVVDWDDPNTKNLVRDGKIALLWSLRAPLIFSSSVHQGATSILTSKRRGPQASIRTARSRHMSRRGHEIQSASLYAL